MGDSYISLVQPISHVFQLHSYIVAIATQSAFITTPFSRLQLDISSLMAIVIINSTKIMAQSGDHMIN